MMHVVPTLLIPHRDYRFGGKWPVFAFLGGEVGTDMIIETLWQ
jgi:hypothetical protein